MERKAYLVGFINRETVEFESCEIFSEDQPSCSFKYFPFTLFWRSGPSFEDAVRSVLSFLDLPEYSFLKQKLKHRKSP